MTDAKVKYAGPCLRCRIGQHEVCYREFPEDEECCCAVAGSDSPVTERPSDPLSILNGDTNAEDDDEMRESRNRSSSRGRSDRHLRDQQSTGRKRAAKLYPLDELAPCEWAGLAKAGGGKHPIVGCKPSEKRTQAHRHHGPDKNPLNNEEGNVHRICAFCHNRWHAKNDGAYVPGEIFNPHDPVTKATEEDQLLVGLEEAQAQHLNINDE